MNKPIAILFTLTILPTETIKYNNWIEYLKSNVYTSLKTLNRYDDKTYDLNKLLEILRTKSKHFHNVIKINFVNHSVIRSIIGQIICCLHNRIKLMIKKSWYFRIDAKLNINVTFIYFKVGSFRPISYWPSSTFQPKVFHEAEYVSVFYFGQRQITEGKILEEIHLMFQGTRNAFTIYSLKNKFSMKSSVFHSTKVKFQNIFSVIDNSLLSRFFYYEETWQKFKSVSCGGMWYEQEWLQTGTQKMQLICYMWYITFTKNMELRAYHVVIIKLFKIKLILSDFSQTIIKIYDGPDANSDLLKLKGNMVILSTFQCYFIIQVESFKASTVSINIYTKDRKTENNIHIEVTSLLQINSNICEKGKFLFCLINVTTKTMHLNISLINMTFSGPDYKYCVYGGISYIQDIPNNNSSDSYKEVKTLCENFTQELASFNKIPMDFVSPEYHIIILIYSYYPYVDDMEVNLEILPTPCKGLIPCLYGNIPFTILKCQIVINV